MTFHLRQNTNKNRERYIFIQKNLQHEIAVEMLLTEVLAAC